MFLWLVKDPVLVTLLFNFKTPLSFSVSIFGGLLVGAAEHICVYVYLCVAFLA